MSGLVTLEGPPPSTTAGGAGWPRTAIVDSFGCHKGLRTRVHRRFTSFTHYLLNINSNPEVDLQFGRVPEKTAASRPALYWISDASPPAASPAEGLAPTVLTIQATTATTEHQVYNVGLAAERDTVGNEGLLWVKEHTGWVAWHSCGSGTHGVGGVVQLWVREHTGWVTWWVQLWVREHTEWVTWWVRLC